ncbi:MAG: hypothetical protein ABSD47_01190 [Candidatus Methylomirabilota bacterium]|jgi:hypothetical protein
MKIVLALLALVGLLLGGIWLIRRWLKNPFDRHICFAGALSVLLWPALALAADATTTSPFQDVLTSIMQLVALVLAGLIAWAVKLLAGKFKLTISADQFALLQSVAKSAVYYTEEWAAKKAKLGQAPASGADKLAAAMTFVTSKLPGVDPTEAANAIHSALGSLAGLGASKAVGGTG